jgi:hypothetical protein
LVSISYQFISFLKPEFIDLRHFFVMKPVPASHIHYFFFPPDLPRAQHFLD